MLSGRGTGDLFVHLAVWTPNRPGARRRKALEDLCFVESPGFQPNDEESSGKDKGFFEKVKDMFGN